ncbi:MAG: hypothetical protein ACRD6N_18140, partial [Pyrinomonadaceae bacterium]
PGRSTSPTTRSLRSKKADEDMSIRLCGFAATVFFFSSLLAMGAPQVRGREDEEFGPVVRAYLGYLRNEQEVVDDRASRHEVSTSYYRRNSNRIRALRQMAIRIARESRNDYLPELEAVTRTELGLLFERPPQPQSFRVGEILRGTFRFLGTVRSAEVFYVFARLDPYEQAELLDQRPPDGAQSDARSVAGSGAVPTKATRTRRVTSP